MVYGVLLAGGSGSRMNCGSTPKQYLTLGTKPILLHSLSAFFAHPEIDRILIICPECELERTNALVKEYLPQCQAIILSGGENRTASLMNGVNYVIAQGGDPKETILVTHDAVRPFVSKEMISENIKVAREVGGCTTAIPATDTILESKDGALVDGVLDRKVLYQVQTPQTFRLDLLKESYDSLTQEEISLLTDATGILSFAGRQVGLVKGNSNNIKITYPGDLVAAEGILASL